MIFSKISPFNADVFTPVELYLSLRNEFRKTCLLESNEYQSRVNSKSYIGLNPIIEIKVFNRSVEIYEKGFAKQIEIKLDKSIVEEIQSIIDGYDFNQKDVNGVGFYGRFGFEFALLSEVQIIKKKSDLDLPDMHLFVFENVIVIDHFTNEGYVITSGFSQFEIEKFPVETLLQRNAFTEIPFEKIGEESFDFSDEKFAEVVQDAKNKCLRGDVFQLVVSNRFEQSFFGDDFQVYRTLRRINPSPYLFYFDFESYRLFGSSPETQLMIKNGKAEIHPIAGTVAKSGNELIDEKKIHFLKNDEKENAEHTMLVDLARNDLSKDCIKVNVEKYKELQHFSHVIHLVSKVTGMVQNEKVLSVFNNSFPAGTLSGTPKPKALELISKMEKTTRDFYGGAIGLIGANGDLNTAIVIRSILSKNNTFYYRAGAGVVLDSIIESEVDEVHHKLKAIRNAIEKANQPKNDLVRIQKKQNENSSY